MSTIDVNVLRDIVNPNVLKSQVRSDLASEKARRLELAKIDSKITTLSTIIVSFESFITVFTGTYAEAGLALITAASGVYALAFLSESINLKKAKETDARLSLLRQ